MVLKMIGQQLDCFECIQLLDKAVEYGLFKRDENNESNLKVYYKSLFFEGWQSIPIIECAVALANDINGQTYIRERLKEKGVELVKFAELQKLFAS